jgi:hypothetical protein
MDTKKIAPPIGETYLNEKYFRPKTKHSVYKVNFFLQQGGLGDYICHMPAFEFLAETQFHLHGRLFVNPPFLDVAKYIMKKYDHWEVHPAKGSEKIMKQGEMILAPANYTKYTSACGAHLLDLGFMYYCNLHTAPPEYNRMPNLEHHFEHSFELPEKYAVVTPGATAKARTMPANGFNSICDYLIEKGITPVFLGKKDFAYTGKKSDYYAQISDEYDLKKGVNLLEKTSLFDAISIMQDAEMVIGLDNGLLHFASTTSVPIIFGHSVTEVHHREIRRKHGDTYNIAITDDLNCRACQSRMRFIVGHRFKYCVYDDYLCLDLLFKDNAKAWRVAIDRVLNSKSK